MLQRKGSHQMKRQQRFLPHGPQQRFCPILAGEHRAPCFLGGFTIIPETGLGTRSGNQVLWEWFVMSAKSWGHSPQNLTAPHTLPPTPREQGTHDPAESLKGLDLCRPGEGQLVPLGLGLLSCPLVAAASGYCRGQGKSYTLAQPQECQPCIL